MPRVWVIDRVSSIPPECCRPSAVPRVSPSSSTANTLRNGIMLNNTRVWNATGAIPLNVTLHGWPVPPPEPDSRTNPPEDIYRPNGTAKTTNLTTGFVLEEGGIEELTDGQTLVLAALGTLAVLVLTVGLLMGIRLIWFRYKGSKDDAYEGVLAREESSDAGKHLSSQLKISGTHQSAGDVNGGSPPTVVTPKSNGSIITMTLKNNHLIVETEEAICVSPSTRLDSRSSTTTYITNSTQENDDTNAHGVLVHRHPEEEDELPARTQTGLSQSDLSMSSSGSQRYTYGNQTAYDSGGLGYSETNMVPPPIRPCISSFNDSREHTQMDRADSVVSETDVNVFLSSDVCARNAALDRQRLDDEGVRSSPVKNQTDLPNGKAPLS